MNGKFRRRCAVLGLLAAFTLPGCLSVFNPLPEPPAETKQLCQQLSAARRDQVYVVLLNGADPFGCGNLNGVRDYLNRLGFVKSYYGQLYHEESLLKELLAVHAGHPDARFVVVGFEYGAIAARTLIQKAHEKDLPIDLLMYLEPKGLGSGNSQKLSAVRVITIQESDDQRLASDSTEGEIIHISPSSRYAVPTNPITLETLTTELTQLAMNVPIPISTYEPIPSILDDPAPTPRPIVSKGPEPIDEWDFLKPVSRQKVPEVTLSLPEEASTSEKKGK